MRVLLVKSPIDNSVIVTKIPFYELVDAPYISFGDKKGTVLVEMQIDENDAEKMVPKDLAVVNKLVQAAYEAKK